MRDFLSNPTSILIVCCVAGLVIGFYSMLFGLLRGGRSRAELSVWNRAFASGQTRQRQQATDLAELRQAVERLHSENPSLETKADDDE